jgi:hypothetical protein
LKREVGRDFSFYAIQETDKRDGGQARNKLVSMKKREPVIRIVAKEDAKADRLFWQNKSPEERVSAVEFLREQFYIIQGYKSSPSIVREIRIVGLKK